MKLPGVSRPPHFVKAERALAVEEMLTAEAAQGEPVEMRNSGIRNVYEDSPAVQPSIAELPVLGGAKIHVEAPRTAEVSRRGGKIRGTEEVHSTWFWPVVITNDSKNEFAHLGENILRSAIDDATPVERATGARRECRFQFVQPFRIGAAIVVHEGEVLCAGF